MPPNQGHGCWTIDDDDTLIIVLTAACTAQLKLAGL